MTRILALDWGEKRIGVAFSEGILASPHSVIKRRSKTKDYEQIVQLTIKTEADLVVLGLPTSFDPNNPIGPQAKRVLKHYRALEKLLDIPIKLSNESYSTVDAANFLQQSGRKTKVPIDAAAAAVILQAFLDTGTKKY